MNSLEHGGRCCLTCIFAVCLLIYFTPLAMITIGNRLNQALIVNPDLKVALIVNLGVKKVALRKTNYICSCYFFTLES